MFCTLVRIRLGPLQRHIPKDTQGTARAERILMPLKAPATAAEKGWQ
jgi:hypothetical protein